MGRGWGAGWPMRPTRPRDGRGGGRAGDPPGYWCCGDAAYCLGQPSASRFGAGLRDLHLHLSSSGAEPRGERPYLSKSMCSEQCGILPDPNLNEGFSLAAGRRSWSATTTNALPRLSGCDLALTRRGPFQPRCVHEATKIALGQRAFVVCTLWLVDRGCGLASTHHTAGTHYAPALFTLHDSRHIGTRERRSHLSITLSTRVPQALFVSLTCQTSEYTYAHSAHKHIRTRRFPPFLPLSALAFPVRF